MHGEHFILRGHAVLGLLLEHSRQNGRNGFGLAHDIVARSARAPRASSPRCCSKPTGNSLLPKRRRRTASPGISRTVQAHVPVVARIGLEAPSAHGGEFQRHPRRQLHREHALLRRILGAEYLHAREVRRRILVRDNVMELGDAALLDAHERDDRLLPVDVIGGEVEGERRRLVDAVLPGVDDPPVPHADARGEDREILRRRVEEDPRIAVAVDRVVGEEHDGAVPPLRDMIIGAERDDERIVQHDRVASGVAELHLLPAGAGRGGRSGMTRCGGTARRGGRDQRRRDEPRASISAAYAS